MFTLEDVVPWGRSFDEYRRMFALSEDDLARRVLGCADGPASFNAELTARGGQVVSCDPLYRHTAAEIQERIEQTYETVIDQCRRNVDEFVWDERIPDVDSLGRMRLAAMERFLADYDGGKAEGRYVDAELPSLPFEADTFDIALCSHFLFLYGGQLSADFHVASLRELCRIGREVRVFPVLELGSVRSRHLDAVVSALRDEGYQITIERVDYEFQRGGNEMQRVRR